MQDQFFQGFFQEIFPGFAKRARKNGRFEKTAIIRKEDGKYVLYSHDGKVLGRHDTKEEAREQEKAIKAQGG